MKNAETFLKDNENKIDEINNLKKNIQQLNEQLNEQLKEKENYNQNNINNEELEKLTKQHEEEKAMSALLRKERQDLENKLNSMKNTLSEIKEKFESEIAKREKMLTENKTDQNNINELIKKD
jgi:hypothetical protein